jgi:hypothetical protein
VTIPADIERVALLGWKVYPASTASKAGCFPGATDAATSDLATIDEWAFRFRRCNWRVVTGSSHLFALDVDRPGLHAHDGFAALSALVDRHGCLPQRPMTKSGGSGGAALFFRHAGEKLRGKSGVPAPGLDPHRGRQAVMIPPSRHPISGGEYTWRVPPWETPPPAIPAWLAELLAPLPEQPAPPYIMTSERAMKALYRAIDAVRFGGDGGRNDLLNRRSYHLGTLVAAGQLDKSTVERSLLDAALHAGLPRKEAQDTIRSGLRAGGRRPA